MSDPDRFDLVVIGAGPGGYVCAIRAAQMGLKVACIDRRDAPGGTCLHIGCIPSKALLTATHRFEEAELAAEMGVLARSVKYDLNKMMAYKEAAVAANTQGVNFLFKKNGIESIVGEASIAAPDKVAVATPDGTHTLAAGHIVIATGSEPTPLSGVEIDEKQIVSSTGALAFDRVPKHLLVIGAGVVGLELGSVWRRLGAEVTVVEYLDRIVPAADAEIATGFRRALEKQGIAFKLATKVLGAETRARSVSLTLAPVADEAATETLTASHVLVAVGRRAHTEGLGLEALGIACDAQGRIETDENRRTSVDTIFAIGDVVAGAMLAHKAEDEGVAVAEYLAGGAGHVDYNVIPSVVYTAPEVAWVGKTEEELAGTEYRVGTFPFSANGRAKVAQSAVGFVKILADAATDEVLGAHILGPQAGELIAELAVAMSFKASSEDIARICHAHPTLSEAVREAALAVDKRALHI